MPTEPLTVRAHHLGCLAHHAVFGDEHPTLPILLKTFRENPDRAVRVVVGPDDICEPCPHWNGTECVRKEGMESMNQRKDAQFLEALALADGDTRTPRELHALMAERLSVEVFRAICPTCQPESCAEVVQKPWLDPL